MRGAFLGAVCTLPMFSLAGWPPTFLVWGLPPPLYGGIGEVRHLIRTPRLPIRRLCTVSCIIGRRIWSPPGPCYIIICAAMHRPHQPSFCRNLHVYFGEPPLSLKGSVAMSLALLGLPLIRSLPGLSLRHRHQHGKVQNNSISAETT